MPYQLAEPKTKPALDGLVKREAKIIAAARAEAKARAAQQNSGSINLSPNRFSNNWDRGY
jgi:hypothetical protein